MEESLSIKGKAKGGCSMSAKKKATDQSEQPQSKVPGKTISLKWHQYDEIYECAGAISELAFL
jgi:hypothetical protein